MIFDEQIKNTFAELLEKYVKKSISFVSNKKHHISP